MDFLKALQTASILIDVIKALHSALTENTEETKKNSLVNAQLLAKLNEGKDDQNATV